MFFFFKQQRSGREKQLNPKIDFFVLGLKNILFYVDQALF